MTLTQGTLTLLQKIDLQIDCGYTKFHIKKLKKSRRVKVEWETMVPHQQHISQKLKKIKKSFLLL